MYHYTPQKSTVYHCQNISCVYITSLFYLTKPPYSVLKGESPCGPVGGFRHSFQPPYGRIKRLWHIKISQAYMGRWPHMPHAHSHGRASVEHCVTQGQRRGFVFIMGKGAKSCWYEESYINANCIGDLLGSWKRVVCKCPIRPQRSTQPVQISTGHEQKTK